MVSSELFNCNYRKNNKHVGHYIGLVQTIELTNDVPSC